jgi:two-component system sensor histidine kinase BaeS
VSGHDELATLAAAFNRMATSIQRGEERQRRMVADVAHELRTPLANLRGYLEALTDGVIEPDGNLFRSLHEETLLQQRIVDDLQTLALAEAGRLAYLWVRTDLVELLETCVTAHHAVAVGARVTLAVESAGPVCALADVDRLRQVVGNLVTNAVRHSPPGGRVVLTAEADGDEAVIQVIDSGSGIPDADLPRVFDRFWRADGARGRGTGGNGLGLAIARQIVLDHRGRIDVHSRLGAGSTFTVTLPRYPTAGRAKELSEVAR